MPHTVKIVPKALKQIAALPGEVRGRILDDIYKLKENPRPGGCKKLKGHDGYRIRVGDYRIIYKVHDDVLLVFVVRVAHRREVYFG